MQISLKKIILFLTSIFSFSHVIFGQNRNPIEIKQLNDHIWLLNDNYETTSFVIIGKEKAAVIDTMYGYENVLNLVQKITNLPLIVINTHGHIDHILGNGYFKQEIFINKNDYNLAQLHYSYPQSKQVFKKNKLKKPKFSFIKEGDVFDLGGITLEVIEFVGHTKGGIMLFDKQDKILFTGDSINRHNWMQLKESSSFNILQNSLEKIKPFINQVDFILHNHAQDFEPISLYNEYCAAIQEVIDGKTGDDKEYQYFGGKCKQHKYSQGEIVIVYN